MATGDLQSKSRVHTRRAFRLNGAPARIFRRGIGLLSRITAKLRAATRDHVPVGYQDETGFHFGIRPEQNESGRPLLVNGSNEL